MNTTTIENNYTSFEDIKKLYPEEWVLLGNPQIENVSVLSGIVLYHSRDKKEVCYLGRDKAGDFATVTIVFAGDLKQHRKTGMLRRI